MPASDTWRNFARVVLAVVCSVGTLVSCAKDPLRVDRNRPPETFLVSAPAESASASYRIHLYWRGEDPDGFIAGFLWSWDDSSISAFRFTEKTDSIFDLTVNDSMALVSGTSQTQPSTVRPHTFFIRAVDNLGKVDPSLARFNRRVYNATTEKPTVRFVGAIPSGAGNDTLRDGEPFKVCWTGSDKDGYVAYYRYDIGPISTGLITDTCAVFNDSLTPGAHPLKSNLYTLTVTAVDNAFAPSDPGAGKIFLVVNRDPETWIEPRGAEPLGHYIQYYLKGQPVRIEGTFAQGDTVPFRSTVWWEWGGEDSDAHGDSTCLAKGGITGWSAVLFQGTRNAGDPYIIGFLDELSGMGYPPIRFTTNNPDSLGRRGFTEQILDSLDASYNMLIRITSRDCSDRLDGTPASFLFNCNRPPVLKTLGYETVTPPSGVLSKRIFWDAEDIEDGLTKGAQLTIDGIERIELVAYEQEIILPETRFRELSPSNPHSITLRVKDRAGVYSDNTLSVQFDVTYPP
jgi:hypothetical protein